MEDKGVLGEFCAEIYKEESFDGCFKIFEKYVKKLGFDGACYTFIPKVQIKDISFVNPVFAKTENFPMSFLEDYEKKQLHNHDFTIRKGKENTKDRYWCWRETELSGDLNQKEIDLIKLAREKHGITNAISIPTLVTDLVLSGASFVSSKQDKEFNQLKKESLETLIIVTKLFHDRNYAGSKLVQIFSKPLSEKLNPTEYKTLELLTKGYKTKQLAEKLNVTDKSAKNIVSNLCKKLGGINRDQLFFLIGRINLLQFS